MEELQIPEKIEITSMETLKALSDPLRMDILKQVGIANRKGDRITVKQLGKLLDMPPTKLYYHVNMLEEQIARLKESGLTVLLAEQNLDVALRLSDRGYVIDNGTICYHGTRDDLQHKLKLFKIFIFHQQYSPHVGQLYCTLDQVCRFER